MNPQHNKQHSDAGCRARRPAWQIVPGLLAAAALVAFLASCAPGQPPAVVAPPDTAPATAAPVEQAPDVQAPGEQAPGEQAPDVQAPGGDAGAAAPTGISFAADVLPILEQHCVSCHGGQRTEAGLALDSYAAVMQGGAAVVRPGDPQGSLLVSVIESGRMPKRAERLPQEQIDTIASWVQAGAADD